VYNADAPSGYYGSIDLQNGKTVKSSSKDGDVQDLGLINGEWAKRIKPENGAEMVIPATDFDFASIDTKEALLDAYASGTISTETDVVLGNSYMFKVASDTAGEFDYFVLKTLEIKEVNTNKDYYVFTLKGYKF